MPRSAFERELQLLQDEILMLGSEVEENLVRCTAALENNNLELSRQLIAADNWVNEKRIKIGMDSLTVIATQQPIAGDMRLLAAVIEIAGELERIHDYVKGIAKINLMLGHRDRPAPIVGRMPEMAEMTRRMLSRSLAAFAERDAALARDIPAADDKVDYLYREIYQEIIDYIMANPVSIEHVNMLEWALHNLERSADRVTNVCEWIVYMVTGKFQEMDSEVEAPPAMGNWLNS